MAERHELGRQESLFEGLAPPRPNPWARPPDALTADDGVRADDGQRVGDLAADAPQALRGETVRPPEAVVGEITIERHTESAPTPSARPEDAGALGGPTLDDVVSRVWEGLAIGLPATCPLCHGEVVPNLGGALSGSCTSCGMTID